MDEKKDFARLHDEFNIEDDLFVTDFENSMEHLVDKCPVARSRVGPGYHVFNRYRDVRRIGQDWRTFSSTDGWMLDPPDGNLPILPEDSDPPYHTAWRQVLNPYFNAKAVASLEAHARTYAAQLVETFFEHGRCDYVSAFAAKLPGLILFQHILPVPVEDLARLFTDIDTYSFGPMEDRAPAFGRVHAYLEELLRSRQRQPRRDDLIECATYRCRFGRCPLSVGRQGAHGTRHRFWRPGYHHPCDVWRNVRVGTASRHARRGNEFVELSQHRRRGDGTFIRTRGFGRTQRTQKY